MARKQHVRVTPEEVLDVMQEIVLDGGNVVFHIEDLAEHFDVHSITMWRKLDALRLRGEVTRIGPQLWKLQ